MKAWIERALNLAPGDLGRGALLCACLFLVITSTVVGKVAGAALFLSRFPAKDLALVDIISALAVSLIVGTYAVASRKTSVANLVAISMVFFAANCVIFWEVAHTHAHTIWLFPVFYGWVRIVAVLAPAQIWTLANCILTTREAKRVFGMVGSGAILGWIVAGFISQRVAKAFGAETLLLAMSILLAICGALVIVTWRYGQTCLNEQPAGIRGAERSSVGSSLRLIFESRYLRAIAAVICVSSFLTTLTGWQFMAIAQQFLVTKNALAVYFGAFNFYAGLVSLFLQVFLTTRFVRRFGVGTSLILLPSTILLGSVGLLVFGTLTAAAALRGCDQIFRYSIDRSTTELLYLPIPARIKLRVKWFIDTVIWRLGDASAGIAVLIFVGVFGLHARQLSWGALFLGGAWLMAVSIARREYIVTLKQNISQHTIDAQQIESVALDRSTSEVLASSIAASDPKEILYALDLLEVDRHSVHPAVRSLLRHAVPEVRSRAISILSDAGDKSARSEVEQLLHDPDLNVRTSALLYLSHNAHIDPLQLIANIHDFADFSVSSAVVAYLGRPGQAQNIVAAQHILSAMLAASGPLHEHVRCEVAQLLGDLPDRFDPLLANLLAGDEPSVVIAAMRSAGKLRKTELTPALVDRLGDSQFCSESAKVLALFGDAVVPLLRDRLSDSAVDIEIRRAIPSVLLMIDSSAAHAALQDNLLHSDSLLRFSVIRSLNKAQRLHPRMPIDNAMIETVLAAEILGHYRSYQILDALGGQDSLDPGTAAMADSIEQERERIFRLLAMLHPSLELHAAYLGLQSKSVTVSDNALEFLDNVLRPQLRDTLLPLLDSRVSVSEKARIGRRFVRHQITTQQEAVAALVSSEDHWLRSCGAYAIGSLGLSALEPELTRCLEDNDPLLREIARVALDRLHLAAKANA